MDERLRKKEFVFVSRSRRTTISARETKEFETNTKINEKFVNSGNKEFFFFFLAQKENFVFLSGLNSFNVYMLITIKVY